MNALPASIAGVCPLCGGANECAMEKERVTGQTQPPCWCTRVDFGAELLGQVPPEGRGRACICPGCAAPADAAAGTAPE